MEFNKDQYYAEKQETRRDTYFDYFHDNRNSIRTYEVQPKKVDDYNDNPEE